MLLEFSRHPDRWWVLHPLLRGTCVSLLFVVCYHWLILCMSLCFLLIFQFWIWILLCFSFFVFSEFMPIFLTYLIYSHSMSFYPFVVSYLYILVYSWFSHKSNRLPTGGFSLCLCTDYLDVVIYVQYVFLVSWFCLWFFIL